MPLIEEKIGIGFAGRLSGQTLRPLRKRCARCEKCFTPRRYETPRSQRLFITAGRPGIKDYYGAITIFQRSRVLNFRYLPYLPFFNFIYVTVHRDNSSHFLDSGLRLAFAGMIFTYHGNCST
jgi:hypothetical protein